MSERGRVSFGTRVIEYSISRSHRRRKTIEITVDPRAGVLVAAPFTTTCEQIEGVVSKRAGWIVRHASGPACSPRPRAFISGESLPYLGRQAQLLVAPANVRRTRVSFSHWRFEVAVPVQLAGELRREAIEAALSRWYKERAAKRLAERAERWAAAAGYAPSRVLIRSQRQRWGSCGPDGSLRFNWRIIMAPPALIDYVVVHELVHLRVKSHAAAFWVEVAQLLPDYKLRRACLKDLGPSLSL